MPPAECPGAELFDLQNVAPIIKQSTLKAQGTVFAQTVNEMRSLLTLGAIRKMNAAVALNQQAPAAGATSS